MVKNLFIVELLVKVKMINKYFGKDFQVLVFYGYVCDFKLKEGVVDFEYGFEMKYEVIECNEKYVDVIVKVVKQVDDIYLVIDLDCEGEVISWYISEIFKECGLDCGKCMYCVVFFEIMFKVIKVVVVELCQFLYDFVDVQQVCWVLDYFVGFNLLLVLWCKVQCGLLVGCVQSLVLCMIVECEEEIEVFVVCEYWFVEVQFKYVEGDFIVCFIKFNGKKFEQFDFINEYDVMIVCVVLKVVVCGNFIVSEVGLKECKC